MAGVNKVIILGNLGKDPEVRFLPNGGAVTNLTLATSETWKDKQTGEAKEKTEWHKVVVFGKLAEIAGEYLKKGSKVYFEGQLQTKKWVNQEGKDQYTTEIVVQGFSGIMQMLDGNPNKQSAPAQQAAPQQQQGGYAQQAPQQGGFNNQPPQQAQPNNQGSFNQQPQPQGQAQGGYTQQAPQQAQGGFGQQQRAPRDPQGFTQAQGGFKEQQPAQQQQNSPKVNPQEPTFCDDIPF
tara:strand:- start:1277 stop:1984 length:708 start_codon:yes stop_codon:yes gene_type:complete